MLLAAGSIQLSLTTPQADGLAAALNVWALAMIVPAKPNGRRIFLAALFFTLAWSAKVTTVFGLAAALVWLLAVGRKRAAWLLAAETLCGYLIVAGATIVASGHRVVEIFRACASGGADWKFIVSGPMRMQSMALYTDPVLFAFAVLGLLLLVVMLVSGKLWRSLPALFLIATLAVTMLIFGSPGTAGNHLLDLQVAAVILLALVALRTLPARGKSNCGVYGLALLTLLAAFVLWRNIGDLEPLVPSASIPACHRRDPFQQQADPGGESHYSGARRTTALRAGPVDGAASAYAFSRIPAAAARSLASSGFQCGCSDQRKHWRKWRPVMVL